MKMEAAKVVVGLSLLGTAATFGQAAPKAKTSDYGYDNTGHPTRQLESCELASPHISERMRIISDDIMFNTEFRRVAIHSRRLSEAVTVLLEKKNMVYHGSRVNPVTGKRGGCLSIIIQNFDDSDNQVTIEAENIPYVKLLNEICRQSGVLWQPTDTSLLLTAGHKFTER